MEERSGNLFTGLTDWLDQI